MIAASLSLLWMIFSIRSSAPATAKTSEATDRRVPPAPTIPTEPVPLLTGAVLGNESARVAVVAFSDFECPFCRAFARDTFPAVMSVFVQSGKVRFAFRHLPLVSIHAGAFGAAEAAECARLQGRFWEMHDALFTPPTRLTPSDILRHAKSAGVEPVAFGRCLSGDAKSAVQADLDEANRLNVKGTPTFFFGTIERGERVRIARRFSGAIPFKAFEKVVSDLLSSGGVATSQSSAGTAQKSPPTTK
jgi:protein-disulfide isomerase